jgi:hypothetical protein
MARAERMAVARCVQVDQHRLVPYASFSTHASCRCHLWSLRQSGQRSGIITPESDSNLIVSVVSPVGTAVPSVGQRIIMLGMVDCRRMGR